MTVTLCKLSREEAAHAFRHRGQMDVSEYAAALRALQVGDSAEVELDGLSSRAAKRRLGLTATRVGYRLKWASARGDDRLYFQVLPALASPAGRAESRQRTRHRMDQPAAPSTVATTQPAAISAPRARRRRVARTS